MLRRGRGSGHRVVDNRRVGGETLDGVDAFETRLIRLVGLAGHHDPAIAGEEHEVGLATPSLLDDELAVAGYTTSLLRARPVPTATRAEVDAGEATEWTSPRQPLPRPRPRTPLAVSRCATRMATSRPCRRVPSGAMSRSSSRCCAQHSAAWSLAYSALIIGRVGRRRSVDAQAPGQRHASREGEGP
jgi:hypothetical protein